MSDKRKKVIMDLVESDFYVPMKEKELAVMLQVSKQDRGELNRILNELLAEGKLSLTKKGKFVKAKRSDKELIGTFISHPKGFGFVEIDGRDEDLYIPENCVNGAFHKDTVKVALLSGKSGKRQEAQVVEILSRGMKQIVGIYDKSNKNFGFVIPDNTKISDDIFVPVERSKGAVSGHKVVCEITDYGKNNRKPEGKIVEILGQQFKVEAGQKVFVHRMEGAERGSKVEFDKVLLIDNEGQVKVGAPAVEGAKVVAEIVSHVRGEKVLVFHKRRRKGYRKLNGHRQNFTEILINEIVA